MHVSDCSATHSTTVWVFRCQFSDHNYSAPVSPTFVNPPEHKNHTDSNETSSPNAMQMASPPIKPTAELFNCHYHNSICVMLT